MKKRFLEMPWSFFWGTVAIEFCYLFGVCSIGYPLYTWSERGSTSIMAKIFKSAREVGISCVCGGTVLQVTVSCVFWSRTDLQKNVEVESITQNGNIGVVTSYYWDRFLQLLAFTEKKTQKVGQMLWNFTTKIAPRNWCTYLFVSLLLTTISMRRGSSNLSGEFDLAFFSALGTCVVLIRL